MSDTVDIYPVGLRADLKRLRGDWWCVGRRAALRQFARKLRRDWRKPWYLNGYHAEVESPHAARVGHGWTKARARLDLARHMAQNERRTP